MNISEMSDGRLFGGKADSEEFDFRRRVVSKSAKHPKEDVPETQPMRRADENNTIANERMAATPKGSYVVSQDSYKALMENLYTARLCLLRARNVTINQLEVHEEEAMNHMKELKRLTKEELDNPETSAEPLAKELVETGTDIIRKQQALNRIEMEELFKSLTNLLITLSSDVKEAKSLAESEYSENKQRSHMDSIFEYGHQCLFILYASVALSMWLFFYLPAFEE